MNNRNYKWTLHFINIFTSVISFIQVEQQQLYINFEFYYYAYFFCFVYVIWTTAIKLELWTYKETLMLYSLVYLFFERLLK